LHYPHLSLDLSRCFFARQPTLLNSILHR
jgi:hypothetical protein